MVRSGFRLPWLADPPPLSFNPIPSRLPFSEEAQEVIDKEVHILVEKGAVSLAPLPSPGFYGRIFVVPKNSGGFRPVLDLSVLNNYLQDIHFRMESPWSVREGMQKGDWASSLDLKDAYFHVQVHPRDRKYLRFTWRDLTYQFNVLPFGLSLAPWAFTRVTRELAMHFRSRGIRIRMYLDDWLILAQSREECASHTEEVVRTVQELGFCLNWEKSALLPAQRFTYLGMTFDTVLWKVFPTEERLQRLASLLSTLMASPSSSARKLYALLGQMESLAPILPLGHLHKRIFQRELAARWDQSTQDWEAKIPTSPWLNLSIAQWLNQTWLREGVPISRPHHDVELFTDASNIGWGAHVESLTAAGIWAPREQAWHINLLEMQAVLYAVQEFATFLSGKVVLLATDNTTVACYLNKEGGTRSRLLSELAESVLLLCQDLDIVLRARHVPGKMNILADQLSRPHCVLETEWTLAHFALEPVWEMWHKPLIDLFSTRYNHRLPTYVSPVPDPQAWAVDALSMSWKGLSAYAFPPWTILGKVLRKIRSDRPSIILIAPKWPAQAWYPDLLNLCHVPPLRLTLTGDRLLQPRSGIPHPNVQALHLHAWLLCSKNCNH